MQDEVKDENREAKVRKAPGCDRITDRTLKFFTRNFVVALSNIINAILRLWNFPMKLRSDDVIMLPNHWKSGMFPWNYRPSACCQQSVKYWRESLQWEFRGTQKNLTFWTLWIQTTILHRTPDTVSGGVRHWRTKWKINYRSSISEHGESIRQSMARRPDLQIEWNRVPEIV